MALRALVKTETKKLPFQQVPSSGKQLYRCIVRELPRVLAIYDIDIPFKQARESIRFHFKKHGKIEDERVVSILLAKGHMEFEETIMHWKQKPHLLRVLRPEELSPKREYSPLEKLLYKIETDEDVDERW